MQEGRPLTRHSHHHSAIIEDNAAGVDNAATLKRILAASGLCQRTEISWLGPRVPALPQFPSEIRGKNFHSTTHLVQAGPQAVTNSIFQDVFAGHDRLSTRQRCLLFVG
jgi:hypothetical protein